VLRLLGYLWAFPMTMVGLFLAGLAAVSGGRAQVRGGVVEASGGLLRRLLRGWGPWAGGAALTVGHVILSRDATCLERSRRHELVHVRQYERWGPFLLPVSWLIGRWLWWQGYDPYLDHPFEREACGGEGRA
jgi:hypothetical protein